MKKTAIVALIILLMGTACYAGDKFCVIEKTPQAKEPIGAVVETTGVFVGKIVSAAEIAMTGQRKLTVENETGECKIFPFCETTKITDRAFNAVTFNKLKAGEKVKVEYAEDGGSPKAKSVIIEEGTSKAK
jgi:hypothetical protein